MNLYERVMGRLEADKANYKHIFHDAKKNEIRLVKEVYTLVPNNTKHVKHYDGELWGKDVPIGWTKNWFYVGKL